MAKTKVKKQSAKAPSVQPNKFETLYNRKKFNVLGKKTKGDQKARGKARSDGTEKVQPELHALIFEPIAVDRHFRETYRLHCSEFSATLLSWWSTSRGNEPMPSSTDGLEVSYSSHRGSCEFSCARPST
jgi:hypothetical protein